MARNAEVTRQWELLRDIDGARNGISVAKLAAERGACGRTIRRDVEALSRAGFPLYDEKVNGTSMWKLHARPFRGLEDRGLSLMELCALYFSRTMLETLSGTPLRDDAERAFARIERALPPGCRKFLDRLPRVLTAKGGGRKKQDERRLQEVLARALDATLLHRRAEMRYASASGTGEMRSFAAERIQTFAVLDETFKP